MRIIVGLAFQQAETIEQTGDAIRWLRAFADPRFCLLRIEHEPIGGILCFERIEGADLLDETAVARHARIGDDDAIERPLFSAATRETNFQRHWFSFLRQSFLASFSR